MTIIDLRIKFSIGEATYNEFTIVNMLNIGQRVVGIVVDEVSDVIKVMAQDIKPPPEFGIVFDSSYLYGLTTIEEQMVILINIESLISSDELGLFESSK